jgi:DNA-binding NtrC family response regulator
MTNKNLKDKKILIIEDHKDIRELIKQEFASTGGILFEAEGGIEAFKILKNNPMDVIISDLVMIHGDGLWLVTKIKSEIKNSPKIFLCSAYGNHLTERMKELGILHIFDKPLKKNNMVATILSYL